MNLTNKAYTDAGVDVHAGYRSVELIKKHVRGTFTPGVLSDIGGFSGLFSLAEIKNMHDPVMVSGTDGVGTKIALAKFMGKHDTIGIDCVAMCVNDIVCAGAKPLFFLDYIACGKNTPEIIEQIVKGVADGCRESGAALIGGETAEHPGTMPPDEYDLAGFAVGIVEKNDIIDGKTIKEGDTLIGLASSGIHSNGFSLIRKIFPMDKMKEHSSVLGKTLGETLLTPTRIYVKSVLSLIKEVKVKGIIHITGGGWYENIPRMMPEGLTARINAKSFTPPSIFDLIQRVGGIDHKDMFFTFNMGLGMILCVANQDAELACAALKRSGEKAFIIGGVEKSASGEKICLE